MLENEKKEIEQSYELLQKDKEENTKIKQENIKLKKENEELIGKKNELKNQYNELLKNIKEIKKEKKKINLHSSINMDHPGLEELDNNYDNKKNRKNSVDIVKEIKDPIKLYNSPTLVGLNYIGATCFMNSTLQCLSQTESLTNYFLREKSQNKIFNNNIAKIIVTTPIISGIL